MNLYDLDNGDLFRWQNSVYRLVDVEDHGQAKAVCVMSFRTAENEWISTPLAKVENFNPYAEVEPGEIAWEPKV